MARFIVQKYSRLIDMFPRITGEEISYEVLVLNHYGYKKFRMNGKHILKTQFGSVNIYGFINSTDDWIIPRPTTVLPITENMLISKCEYVPLDAKIEQYVETGRINDNEELRYIYENL